ncbi:CAMK/DAPK/DAPK protein kinase, variant [Aphelenchoides besseyi]|nr:CAMK/DAPK/DAPK protein kinase, variant [Aphelenchoides besseyi]KAI6207692.1 CAMK/DAPK/DAPK protein kinase, variant [Aphelenchoides besseyi]
MATEVINQAISTTKLGSVATIVSELKFNEEPVDRFYEIGDELGSGQFAVVRRVIERSTGEAFAAKFVKKRRYATSRRGVSRENIEREIRVLQTIKGHENVIELHDVFETPNEFVLILELVTGGELFDHVCAHECLDELEAAAFIRQVCYGLLHLHRRHVVHMDIKPENILLKRKNDSHVKLIDFGLSRMILPGETHREMVGTPEFVSPQIVNYEPIGPDVDCWALGVVCYILLSGGSPFLGRTRDETFCNITAVNYHFSSAYFGKVSSQAKDFISRLLVRDVRRRMSIEDALRHAWIRPDLVELADVRRSSIINSEHLRGFKHRQRWRRIIDTVQYCVKLTKLERKRIALAKEKSEAVETKFNPDDFITSAILVACEEQNIDALEQLVNVHRLDLNVVNALGETPTHVAAGVGSEKLVAFLQRRGVPTDAEDSRGDTPLFWAARNGHASLIRFMIASKNRLANVNHVNKTGESALHLATSYGQVECALALLECGASVDVVDKHAGESPLHIASWHGYSLLLSILCRFNPRFELTNQSRSYARLTTKDPIISSARQSPRTDNAPHILEIAYDFPPNDLSSSLATSDEEEIDRVVESPQPEFPSEIFVPTTQSDDSALVSASSSTSQGSAMTRSGRSNDSALSSDQQTGDSREVVKRILADPERVAASNFNELVHSLTDSLNRNGQTNRPRRDSSTSRRLTRVDPATNPFHPLYASTRSTPKGPILPLEGSSKPPWEEVDFNSTTSNGLFSRPSFVPALDTLRPTFNVAASNVEMRLKPSETLVGLSQHNPFRLEAWTEPEERQVATARYTHTQTEDLHLLKRKDVAVGTVGGKDDEEDESYEINGGQVTPDDEYEISTRILSKSAPATTRKPAPCAVAYPSTAVFIRMVNSVLATGMMPPGGKFYVDGCFTDDETALHCAASRGHLECVQSLLESGAPMDARDLTGRTALHHTLSRSHTDIALLLITKGCNVEIADKNGDTALHVAARQGLVTSVQTLCHVGATVDPLNSQSLSPLHVAAREGHVEVVRCLCLSGADVNLQSGNGQTAEMIAIQNDQQTVADLLSKLKTDHVRESAMAELCPQDAPLRRIKLKLFGHSEVGKSRLVQSLQSGVMNKFTASLEAVSRRFSDNLGTGTGTTSVSASSASLGDKSNRLSDEGIASCASSISSESDKRAWASNGRRPAHPNYTHGIDVQNANFPGCGEFSCWEFGGYEPFHVIYDLCVGNADCVHVVVVRASDPTEVQYVQVLYWMNFLKGRVTPSEPIGHCGIVSRRSKVVIIGTHATPIQFPDRNTDDTSYTSSDVDAMLKTVRLRFETHFDIHDRLILLDSTNLNCPGLKALRIYLQKARESIVSRLQKPLVLLDNCINYLSTLRKRYATFPVITWPHFVTLVRSDCNPLISDQHARQLIQQLQLLGELVYLRDELSELDYVVLVPDWLTTHILGTLLSAEFLGQCHTNGIYSIEQFGPVFPEITETEQLLHMLDTLQLCVPIDGDGAEDTRYEFPALILNPPPKDYWAKNRPNYIYGGLRILPMRGMERSLQSTFPRIQVAMRRSMHDFQDPLDAELNQYLGSSKMCSGRMEALVRLHGDAVEIQVRGPAQMSASCVYFLEDIANLVEQTASEVAPGIALERHFLSPQQLKEHRSQPASFPPEEIMAMQQRESLSIRNTDGNEELFTDVVCFGSRDVASVLTLGVDVSVSQLQLAARCELASLLDPPDAMGRDWSILAVKLNLAEQLPEVDSTGQSLSRTDQLLAEWALQQPESASIGKLCSILEEMGRQDARDVLYRTVPLYIFAPVEDAVNGTGSTDSGQ